MIVHFQIKYLLNIKLIFLYSSCIIRTFIFKPGFGKVYILENYFVLLLPVCYCFVVLLLTYFFIYTKIKLPLAKLVAFGSGALVMLVLYDFVPKIMETESTWYMNILLIISGFLINGLAEILILPNIKFLNQFLPKEEHDCRKHDYEHIHHYHILPSSVGCSIVGCFILCAFFDGIRLSSSLLMGFQTTLLTSIGLLCHLLPESITVIGIALSSGLTAAITGIILFYCLALLSGASSYLFFSHIQHLQDYALPIAVGLFVYVCSVHLIPIVIKMKQKTWLSIGAAFCFIFIYLSEHLGFHSH